MSYIQITEQQEALPRTAPSAAQALQLWLLTDGGRHTWKTQCAEIAPQAVCAALARTQATCFGVLVTAQSAIIWSRFSALHFERRAGHYEQAMATGLCFWWDGQELGRVTGSTFLALLATLPLPERRLLSGSRRRLQ